MDKGFSDSFLTVFLCHRGLYPHAQSLPPDDEHPPILPPLRSEIPLGQDIPAEPPAFSLPPSDDAQHIGSHEDSSRFAPSVLGDSAARQTPGFTSHMADYNTPENASGPAFAAPPFVPAAPPLQPSHPLTTHPFGDDRMFYRNDELAEHARMLPQHNAPAASFRPSPVQPHVHDDDGNMNLPDQPGRDDHVMTQRPPVDAYERIISLGGQPSGDIRALPQDVSVPVVPYESTQALERPQNLSPGAGPSSSALNECRLCPKSFKRKHDLRRHVAVYHENVSQNFRFASVRFSFEACF